MGRKQTMTLTQEFDQLKMQQEERKELNGDNTSNKSWELIQAKKQRGSNVNAKLHTRQN
jgi:hypothetical protein